MTDDKIELTRRKILASTGAVGAAGAGAGLGTSALFSDTESFENNSITAGTLDMSVKAEIVAANQYWEEQGIIGDMETANGDPVVGLEATDVKPGDWAIICFTIDVQENPGCVTISTENLTNYENGQTEPEIDAEGDDGAAGGSLGTPLDGEGKGELQNELVAEVWRDFDDSVDSESPEDYLTNRDPTTPDGTTLVDADDTYSTGVTVGGGVAFNTSQFYLLLELPIDVGNEVQSDAVEWDLQFDAVQARNNEQCRNNEGEFEAVDDNGDLIAAFDCIESDQTIQEYYDYENSEVEGDAATLTEPDKSIVFVYCNTNTGDRHLVFIHDDETENESDAESNEIVGEADFSISGTVDGSDTSSEWTLQDDGGENAGGSGEAPNQWSWIDGKTDGGALAVDPGFGVTVNPDPTTTNDTPGVGESTLDGLQEWVLLDSDGSVAAVLESNLSSGDPSPVTFRDPT